jgi:GNAT acetyltransferase
MQPCWAIPVDGRAVAVCRSVRVRGMHREAGADTLAEFRLRGYGTDVVAAWALDLLKADLVPLYSTNWENIGSLGIARKLRMKQIAVEFRIE